MAEPLPPTLASLPRIEEVTAASPDDLARRLADAEGPFVVRGLVRDWPLVQAGLESPQAARDYLLGHAHSVPFQASVSATARDGRLFYGDDFAMNFRTETGTLADLFARFDAREAQGDGPALYLSSVDMRTFFRGLTAENPSPVRDRDPLESIWIGTETRVAAHNDFPRNLACCAVGRRRFTLFPPDQFANLYLGPIDNTPAGRPVSMADLHAPDLAAHPRFAEALKHGRVAELEPGDAIYIPSLWWHHVEGLAGFNVLVNYWWRDTPRFLGQPQNALYHAILAVRDLPAEEKAMWRAMFDHYVFDNGPDVTDHLPEAARGILAPLTAETAGKLRAFLLRSLTQ